MDPVVTPTFSVVTRMRGSGSSGFSHVFCVKCARKTSKIDNEAYYAAEWQEQDFLNAAKGPSMQDLFGGAPISPRLVPISPFYVACFLSMTQQSM